MIQFKSSSRTRALTRLFKQLFREHPNTTYFEIEATMPNDGVSHAYSLVKDMDKNWVVTEVK